MELQEVTERVRKAAQFVLREGCANDTWVEVIRIASAGPLANGWQNDTETSGVWFWHATGSGLWWNTGRTYVERSGHRGEHYWFAGGRRARVHELSARGYDSLQFPYTTPEYRSADDFPMRNNRVELIDIRPARSRARWRPCPESGLRAGWAHSRHCVCSNERSPLLNCAGASTVDGVK